MKYPGPLKYNSVASGAWDTCDRCTHPRWGHFKDGCHSIDCAIYAVAGMMTGPSRCPTFVEPAKREEPTDDPTQAREEDRSKAREAVDRAQQELNAQDDRRRAKGD